jgi:hypothetical protein
MVSQEERTVFWEAKRKGVCTCVLFRTVSEIELFHCTVVWNWRPILSFLPALLRHSPVILDDRMTGHNYLDFLQNGLPEQLVYVPLAARIAMYSAFPG